ncbi:hypothetical protein [Nocardia macrotermitis]|uniref:DUF8176 domain-containing protein n=1 Tax=Nocardia macrotermitis TaxID=2585198 RepID=A0A7K0DDS7_9NOCA|nr:hypothetical protein [Nocardia macrotermitis]MQY23014.1 hypothetical protein [Nocardia macrotermitis]
MPENTSDDSDEYIPVDIPPAPHRPGGPDSLRIGDALEPMADSAWLVPAPSTPPGEPASSPGPGRGFPGRVSLRGWAGLAAVVAVAVGVVVGAQGPRPAATHAGAGGSTTPSSASAAAGACAGLSGRVVTDRGGDRSTVPGVIATFEDAYYTQRNAEAAVRVVAPESGITQQALAAGIDSIPVGTVHCVAITPVTANTATVHLVELHADGKRVDYLQVINTISGPNGSLLISHVQEQG